MTKNNNKDNGRLEREARMEPPIHMYNHGYLLALLAIDLIIVSHLQPLVAPVLITVHVECN